MTKKKEEIDKVYKKNYIKCLSCDKEFHRCKSLISENNFCSIECKAVGMSEGLTKPMRKGTGKYDKITPKIRNKFYKYKRRDMDSFNTKLDYSISEFIDRIKNGECFYCGCYDKLGLDRIDNKLGHILSNTIVCCETCNMTRGNRFSVDEMVEIGLVIKKIKENR